MADLKAQDPEKHQHTLECGHTKIMHDDHIDFVEGNGHLHHKHEGHWDECHIDVNEKNPDTENHVSSEIHDDNCGHEKIAHGDHYDYLVNGRLQHVHNDHVDDHGSVNIVK